MDRAYLPRGAKGYIPVDPKVGAMLAIMMSRRLGQLMKERDEAKK